MLVTVENQKIFFKGILDESTELSKIIAAFDSVKQSGTPKFVYADFSQVKFANSAGILAWLKILKQLSVAVVYDMAPKWLVLQFNMVPQLIDNKNPVNRIEIPFYNQKTEAEKLIYMSIGKDIPILDSYASFKIKPLELDGDEWVPDFFSEKFFSFIAKNRIIFDKVKNL